VVGLDGALPGLVGADLQGVHLRGVDFSFARLSCSMVRGCFDGCLFHSAIFDTCRMTAARFVESWFDEATLDSPWMDDAVFHRCSFAGGRLSGRGMREFGGRRALFEDCDFTRLNAAFGWDDFQLFSSHVREFTCDFREFPAILQKSALCVAL